MCFGELHYARIEGRIALTEYTQRIAAHFGGLRHEADEDYVPAGFEEEIKGVVLSPDFKPLDEDRK